MTSIPASSVSRLTFWKAISPAWATNFSLSPAGLNTPVTAAQAVDLQAPSLGHERPPDGGDLVAQRREVVVLAASDRSVEKRRVAFQLRQLEPGPGRIDDRLQQPPDHVLGVGEVDAVHLHEARVAANVGDQQQRALHLHDSDDITARNEAPRLMRRSIRPTNGVLRLCNLSYLALARAALTTACPSQVCTTMSRSPELILVVDDDASIRAAMRELLETEGYDVTEAANGLAALGKLRAGLRPAVILLDLMMPVMDGWDLRTEQLRDPELAAIPVLIVTAAGFSLESVTAQFGATIGFVPKPPMPELLLEEVRKLCRHARAARRPARLRRRSYGTVMPKSLTSRLVPPVQISKPANTALRYQLGFTQVVLPEQVRVDASRMKSPRLKVQESMR